LTQTQKSTGFGEQNIAGQASFSFLGTSVPGDTSFQSGSSFASFLLGDAIAGATETVRENWLQYPNCGIYAQDDWQITRPLTLNLDVRWDFATPPVEKSDWFSASPRTGRTRLSTTTPAFSASRALENAGRIRARWYPAGTRESDRAPASPTLRS
jgi:hypothetical protein